MFFARCDTSGAITVQGWAGVQITSRNHELKSSQFPSERDICTYSSPMKLYDLGGFVRSLILGLASGSPSPAPSSFMPARLLSPALRTRRS